MVLVTAAGAAACLRFISVSPPFDLISRTTGMLMMKVSIIKTMIVCESIICYFGNYGSLSTMAFSA